MLTDYLNAAAEGGFLDIIMLQFNPFYEKGGEFDQALDAAHEAGIGLVAMKTMRTTKDVPKRLPEFDKLGLTTHQAVLHSAWSDPRISAVCNMIDNVDQMSSSAAAARSYKAPLKFAHMELLQANHSRRPPHDVHRLPVVRGVCKANQFCLPRHFPFRHLLRAGRQHRGARILPCAPGGSPRRLESESRRVARRLPFQD